MVYGYQYDQLNRIRSMNAYRGFDNQTNTFSPIAIDDYKERITYDPNGNIMGYTRNGTTQTGKQMAMDNMSYNYTAGTNKLTHVNDAVSSGNYPEDIDDQAAGNYTYDAIGNMTGDAASGISNISWTVYGKIASITKSGGTISYTYDAAGNRVSKTVGTKTTVYVRDATGNVMALYEAIGTAAPKQAEVHLYGSSRLGIAMTHDEPAPGNNIAGGYGTAKIATFIRGEKFFELTNHLGNVLATVSDKRIAVTTNGRLAYYNATL
jgi:YD repeat-containing protein